MKKSRVNRNDVIGLKSIWNKKKKVIRNMILLLIKDNIVLKLFKYCYCFERDLSLSISNGSIER